MLKARNIIIILCVNYLIMAFLSVILEMRSIASKAAEIDSMMTTAADMALEQVQFVDEFMAHGGRDQYTMMMPSSAGNGFVLEDAFLGIYGIDSSLDSNRDNIFSKLYETPELRDLATRTGPMRRAVRYYANPMNPDQNMAWYYVPRLAQMGLDVLPNVPGVRGIKDVSGAYISPEAADRLFSDYDYESHIKLSAGAEYSNTPVNLGVTYLNKDFLSTTFINNMDLLMRRKYSANLNTEAGGNGVLKGVTYTDKMNGDLSAYNPINNGSFTILRGARNPSGGGVDTFKGVTPNIEYKVIDMYDPANDTMLSSLFGANKEGMSSKAEYLKSLDSEVIDPATGVPYQKKPIVVAKVSFYLDVVVPYYSIIARDLASRYGTPGANFIDLAPTNKEGVGGTRRITYTRYFAVTP